MASTESDEQALNRFLRSLGSRHAVLSKTEQEWKAKGPLLETRGFLLRPRYRHGWTPSWTIGQDNLEDCEDFHRIPRAQLIDATRVEDGRLVYIKRVGTGDLETEIVLKLTRESLRADPRNHCVPVLDVIQDDVDPSVSYLVMPYLRLMDDPAFENVEEAVDFVDQILDGLVFIHEQGVAHRDCSLKNLMMDATPLYPRGFHPVQSDYLPDVSSRAPHLSRAEAPVKYYFIDFGISVDIPVDVHPKLATGILGRDRDPPELSSDKPYDPFKLDVFILGNVFRKEFREKFSNVEFLQPLIASMTALDADSRPDAAGAQQYWRTIRSEISTLQRVARLRSRNEVWAVSTVLDIFSFVRIGMLISSGMFNKVMRLLQALRQYAHL